MGCPICDNERIPSDASVVEKQGKRVMVRGEVRAIVPPDFYSPFRDYAGVTLKPRKGKVKYLKFKTQQERERWPFEMNRTFIVHGCLHVADMKELVFDITHVEPSIE